MAAARARIPAGILSSTKAPYVWERPCQIAGIPSSCRRKLWRESYHRWLCDRRISRVWQAHTRWRVSRLSEESIRFVTYHSKLATPSEWPIRYLAFTWYNLQDCKQSNARQYLKSSSVSYKRWITYGHQRAQWNHCLGMYPLSTHIFWISEMKSATFLEIVSDTSKCWDRRTTYWSCTSLWGPWPSSTWTGSCWQLLSHSNNDLESATFMSRRTWHLALHCKVS